MKKLPTLVSRLLCLADTNGTKYLVSLNLKALSRSKPENITDPRAYYQSLQDEARKGPLFDEDTLNFVADLPSGIDKNILQWLATCKQRGETIYTNELPSLLDYLRAENPNLDKFKYHQVAVLSHMWHQQFQQNSTPEA